MVSLSHHGLLPRLKAGVAMTDMFSPRELCFG